MSQAPAPGHGDLVSTPHLLVLAVVAFVVEVALFGGVGGIAYELAGGGLGGWVAAAAGTAAVVILWGLFVAPKARFHLSTGRVLSLPAVIPVNTYQVKVLDGRVLLLPVPQRGRGMPHKV